LPGYELIGKEELESISKIFENDCPSLFRYGAGNWAVDKFEKDFAKFIGVKYAHAVSSGTAAIHCALAGAGIQTDDEVITSSFTFVAPVEAIIALGATPIPVEIDETYHLDPEAIKKAITSKTKAIVSIPMWESPKMDEILEICQKNNLILIEDSAQCLGGTFKQKKLGSFGQIGSFSFDMGKSITVGEGGMVVTDDKELYDKMAEFSDHGHMHVLNLPRGKDPRRKPGLNFRMSELSGAVGLAQLKKLPDLLKKQQHNFDTIKKKMQNLSLYIRPVLNDTTGTGDTMIIHFKSDEQTKKVTEKLLKQGICIKILPEALDWHFAGSWTHIFNEKNGYHLNLNEYWPNTYDLLSRSIALPIKCKMSDKEITNLVQGVIKSLN